ncbi:MAG: CvpA family protein [Bryobacteraceae bacterium]|nr:CvpA family protein [Bryobacteraceae bacterium]
MNWVDWVLIAMLAGGVVDGFRAGFVRLVIGMVALIVGFFAASWFHGSISGYLLPYVPNQTLATLISCQIIFFGVLVLGAMIAALIVRVFKLVGLTPVDRVLGAGVGLVRASLILVVIAMLIMAFIPNRLPAAVHRSTIAPYIFGTSNAVASATPYEIRQGVENTYAEIREQIERLRPVKRLPARKE